MTALEPRLTTLDERLLSMLSPEHGQRARDLAVRLHVRTGEVMGYGGRKPSARQHAEVRLILRGLEHLGRAVCRGGWWRAV